MQNKAGFLFAYSSNSSSISTQKVTQLTCASCHLGRWLSAIGTSGSVDTDLSKDCLVARLVISFAAGASDIAEDAVAALWSVVGELRIRLAVAGANLDAHIASGGTNVAGAADEARETVGIGVALRSCRVGTESHGGGNDGRLEEKTDHFGNLFVCLCVFVVSEWFKLCAELAYVCLELCC